ncbi:MAG TPA: hypothetical protein VF720_02000, partial [Candidatus Eisenbacteria bacterium]
RGPQGGEFAPAGALTSPGQQSMGQVDGRWRLGDRATIDGEFALSGQDLNTFSPIDDDDNSGNAGRLNLAVAPVPLAFSGLRLGDIAATAEHRHLSEHFAPLGRIDASFTYDRDWNLPPRTGGLAEDRTGGVVTWRPIVPLSLIGDLAHLSGSGRSSDRRNARAELSGRVSATGSLLVVDSEVDTGTADGRLTRETLGARSRVKFLVPSARYEAEERTDPVSGVGARYWLGGGDIGVDGLGPVHLTIGAERRVDDRKGAAGSDTLGWQEDTDAVTKRGSLSLSNWNALTASLLYQTRDVERSDGGTSETDLAQFDVSRRSSDAAFGVDFHYQVGTNGVESRTRMLVFVGEGMGSYDEFGNLFPGGGYDLVEGPLGAEEVISDVDASLHLELVPYRARDATGALGWLHKNVGWNATGRVEERSRLPLGRFNHLLDFGAFQDTANSLGGRVTLRQTAEIFPSSRTATIRLSQEYDDIANYQFSNFREDRNESLYGVGVRWTPGPLWTLEGTQKFGTRSQEVTAGDASPRVRRANVLESIGQATWRPSPIVRALLALTWHQESESDDAYATALDLNPRFSWSIGQKGRLEAGGRWVEADRHGGYTGIGGFSSLALQDRIEATVDGDYRLLDVLTLGAGLAGRRPEGSRFIVDGRMEVRAYF